MTDKNCSKNPMDLGVHGHREQDLDVPQPIRTSSQGSEYELIRNNSQDEQQNPDLRRSTRQRRMPARYSDYELLYSEEANPQILISNQVEPANFRDACKSTDKNQWMIAMEEEMNSLKTNKTWDLVPLPPNRKALKNRWVYKVKEEDGERKRYRA